MVESVPLIQFVFSSIKENEMRLTKRQLKRIIREEYRKVNKMLKARNNRRRNLREGSFADDPIEDAWWCVSETCELEPNSTQITHDLHYVAEKHDLDQMLSRYIRAGEKCTYSEMGDFEDTAEKWKKFLLAAGPEGVALAKDFSDFWERHYMG